ncbi:hypothetical protein [Streptobacillus canis]|uniref:hypothetical protein n=1 Tax=Streptobacillus canis TaxID=2678686 RepID=UPI0012E0EDBB|nr:hypothetical protein [Streptobacillus canis]
MNNLENKINEAIIINPEDKIRYRLSNLYLFRSFILLGVIIFTIFYVGPDIFKGKLTENFLVLFLILGLVIYVVYHLMTIFKFNITVDKDMIVDSNNKIMINQIEKLSIRVMKISNKNNENCLVIKTKDKKEYVFRLNINNKYKFIKQISMLTGLNVIIEE